MPKMWTASSYAGNGKLFTFCLDPILAAGTLLGILQQVRPVEAFASPLCTRQRSVVCTLQAAVLDQQRMPGRLGFSPVPFPRTSSPRRYRQDRVNRIRPEEASMQAKRCRFPTWGGGSDVREDACSLEPIS